MSQEEEKKEEVNSALKSIDRSIEQIEKDKRSHFQNKAL